MYTKGKIMNKYIIGFIAGIALCHWDKIRPVLVTIYEEVAIPLW